MGTHVVSGSAKAVVVHTAESTEFGKVSERLRLRPPETGFELGIRHFGYFLMEGERSKPGARILDTVLAVKL
jgi:Mg2+-importing ATPase